MKSVIISLVSAALFLVNSLVNAYVDLGPAYSVRIGGSTSWKEIQKYEKDPVFVEGLEFLDNSTLIESVGLYYGSKLRKVSMDYKMKSSAN
jgi:glutamine cyclotransferase